MANNNIFIFRKFSNNAPVLSNFKNQKNIKYRYDKVLTLNTMNQEIVKYHAIKSKIQQKVEQYLKEINAGKSFKLKRILPANVGDLQSAGQLPITFLRQVLALCMYPELFKKTIFPDDVKGRARSILSSFHEGSIGSCTDPQGLLIIRKHIADYIMCRDHGIESKPENIFLQEGLSNLDLLLKVIKHKFNNKQRCGVFVPVPSYPGFNAILQSNSIVPIYYNLDDKNDWAVNINDLKEVIRISRTRCQPIGIIVINPGNPTGQVLSKQNIEEIIKFCYKQEIFVFADEVYQQNIFCKDKEFVSFKHVKHKLGKPFCNVELISLISASKGVVCECGLRGSCLEFDEVDENFMELFLLYANLKKCPNVCGQIALDIYVKPPHSDDESYDLYMFERNQILSNLKKKAKYIVEKLNCIDGLTVNPIQGGLYAFAKVDIPENAVEEAVKVKVDPSLLWCSKLLDETGVAVVPGCTFLQLGRQYCYFRLSIVQPIEVLEKVIDCIKMFQSKFLKMYKK